MRPPTSFLGKVFVVVGVPEEERIAARPAAVVPGADPVDAIEAEDVTAHRALLQLARFADPLATPADFAQGVIALILEGHTDIIAPESGTIRGSAAGSWRCSSVGRAGVS